MHVCLFIDLGGQRCCHCGAMKRMTVERAEQILVTMFRYDHPLASDLWYEAAARLAADRAPA